MSIIGRRTGKLAHEQLDLLNLSLSATVLSHSAQRVVVTADYLLLCRTRYRFIIEYTVARHIHTHIRRRLIGALTENLLEHSAKHREYLYVTVVVNGGHIIRFKMEGVDHIYIRKIRGSRLISKVDRMIERNIPDREGLKLGISRLLTHLALVIDLA